MKRSPGKLHFYILLQSLPIKPLLRKIGFHIDIIEAANAFYWPEFSQAPRSESAVILPHCLISDECPAKFSKADGILCVKCRRCGCGEIKQLCEKKGLQFYVSPSTGFTKRLSQRKNLKAAIGAACDFEIEKGLQGVRLSLMGVQFNRRTVIPQVCVTKRYDCLSNELDWDRLKKLIEDLP